MVVRIYRGSHIDDTYQVSVHLAKRVRGDDFLEINQSETRIVCGGHFCKRIGMKLAIFIEDLPKMLPTKFGFIWQCGFRGEDLKKSANQKQELPLAACL
jgi:hypothetical protein